MQVAVEHAVDQRALERRDQPGLQQRVGVDAGGVHRLDVVEREAAQPLHHQHAPGDQRRVRAGHDDPALVGPGEHVRDVEHVLGLEPEVELLDDRLREQLDQRRRVGERGDGDAADRRGASHDERGDVVAEELRDLRALHLDDDLFAGDEAGRVHLRDRGRRDRHLVERREELLERAAEVDLDDGAHVGERLGRHLVAEQLELGDQLVGEQALAAGDDLAELHVARAEALERPAGAGRSRRGTAGAGTRRRASRRARRQISVMVRARRPSGGTGPARAAAAPRGGCRGGGGRSPTATGSRRDRGPTGRDR